MITDAVRFALNILFVELHDIVKSQCVNLWQVLLGRVCIVTYALQFSHVLCFIAERRMSCQHFLAYVTLDVTIRSAF